MSLVVSVPCSNYAQFVVGRSRIFDFVFLCHAVLKERSQSILMDRLVEVMFVALFIECSFSVTLVVCLSDGLTD